MKKQLFFILLLAFLASSTNILAQAVDGSDPRPLSCTTGPYNPIAGVPYDYSADVNPATGEAYWFATASTTFVTAGAISAVEEAIGGTYVAAGTNYQTTAAVPAGGGATAPAGRTTTTITWTSQGIANATVGVADPPELFVVVNYDAPATGCANNLKVYPIRPINAFTVDIRNIEDNTMVPMAYDLTDDQCAPGVQSAVYVPGVDGSIDYDFGINYLYFEVIASNFTEFYTPSFQLSGLISDQTADIDWGYTLGTYDHVVVAAAGNGNWTDDENVTTLLTNTSTGVSIYVRVTVYNNDTEGLAQIPITLAVDAVNSALQPDVLHTDCSVNGAFADLAIQNVNPRPTVDDVAPNTFLPVQP